LLGNSTLLEGGSDLSLKDRVALVTGGSRGIGKEIALALGRAGARVAVSYHTNKLAAQKVANELGKLNIQSLAIATDIIDPERVKQMVDAVVRHFGRLDILVNNVGDFQWKPVADSTLEEWHAILASNLSSVFYTSKFSLPVMRRQRWGRMINLGAVGAERAFGQAKISAFSAAKAGIVAFSRSLALEEARYGITVNVVNPATIDDKEISREEAERMTDARFPVGRPATAQDVAEAVKFFASEGASFITGQVLNVSGGWML
jgi:3-oxoacyl-[acyl-carrier protein] reductase